ncbi:MAG: EpsG family protein [Oscillospiraceae bacterium]|nr:EpsG family protein [Oscillospiraceae bacterium]
MLVYLAIVAAFCVIYPFVPRKYIKWLFLALVLALSVMAFFVVPEETDDLSNYFWRIANLRKGGFSLLRQMIEDGSEDWDSLPVCGLYFYLISRFPDNGMLPAVTIFLAYGSIFWVLWRAAKRYEVNKWYLFLASVFLLSTYWFYDICSGIRNGLTFTLFCFFAYVELVEKKWRPACWVGYVAMCLMHSSGILMMMVRLALLVSGRKGSKLTSVLIFFVMIVGGAIMPHLGEITGIEYFQLLSQKAERAVSTSGFANGTQYLVNVSVFVVAVCVFYYAVYVIKKQTEKYESFSDYINFVQLIVFFMLGSITFILTFIRFARWVIPAVISVVFMVGMQANSNAKIEMLTGRKNKSVIKSGMTLSSNELVINLCMVAYTAVHMWYACNGTSLIWLKFS